jgi:thioredoxin 1
MARHQATVVKTPILAVTEEWFRRHVLASPLPVLVLFGTPAYPASRALRPLLQELAAVHGDHIRIAALNAERGALVAEQFGVQATPSMLLVQDVEVVTRVIGPAQRSRGSFWGP